MLNVAVSADGRVGASCGEECDVLVWNLDTGACRDSQRGANDVWALALSADGGIGIYGGTDQALHVFDVVTGALLRTLTGHTGYVEAVAVAADGRIAVSGGRDGTVRVWDLASAACLRTLTGHTGDVRSVALSADGRTVVSGSADTTVRVWNLPATPWYRARWSYPRPRSTDDLLAGAAAVEAAVCEAEALLAAGDGPGAAARLRAARAVAGFRRDPRLVGLWGQLAALGVRGRLLDAWPQHTLTGHAESVRSVAVSADGRIAVSGSKDCSVRVWDVTSGTCLHTLTEDDTAELKPVGDVTSVAVSADGRIAVSADLRVLVWDLVAGRCLRTLGNYEHWETSLAVTADGRKAVAGSSWDGTMRVWALAAGTCIQTLTDDNARDWGTESESVAVSADGRILVSATRDGRVRVWDLAYGVCLKTLTAAHAPVAVSADARLTVCGGGRLYDEDDDHDRDKDDHNGVDQDDDGAPDDHTTLRVWGLNTGDCLRSLTGHTARVSAAAMSADGRIAVTGSEDGTVRVWDLDRGACLSVLTGHSSQVWSVALSADGRIAMSAGNDHTVRHWVLDWDYEFDADDPAGSTGRAR